VIPFTKNSDSVMHTKKLNSSRPFPFLLFVAFMGYPLTQNSVDSDREPKE